jgi:hypothetical protein
MAPPVANKPYFVPHRPGTSDSVRDAGDGVDVEELPASVDPDDFAPKFVNFRVRLCFGVCEFLLLSFLSCVQHTQKLPHVMIG